MADQTSVDLVLAACDACVDEGTMTRGQRFAVRISRRLMPRRFKRIANDICDELAVESPTPPTGDGYTFDPDVFERLLKILIEYLPQLLAIILPLFTRDDD